MSRFTAHIRARLGEAMLVLPGSDGGLVAYAPPGFRWRASGEHTLRMPVYRGHPTIEGARAALRGEIEERLEPCDCGRCV